MTLVKSIVRRAQVVTKDESVATAMQRLATDDVGALLVICDGRVCGILSERDVLRRVIVKGLSPVETRVGAVATPDPIAVGVEASIGECVDLIRSHGFRHLPIVDGERHPIGMVSARDLLEFMVEGEAAG